MTKYLHLESLLTLAQKYKPKQQTRVDTSASLGSLITSIEMSQSQKIKFGLIIEKIFADYIFKNTKNLQNIKPTTNQKGSHERDHLWLDNKTKTVVYAEFKSNLELDTEKSLATCLKCLKIESELKKQFNDHRIITCLVGCRYLSCCDIPQNISKRYTILNNKLFGINDYLTVFGCDIFKDFITYRQFLNDLAKTCFN